MTPSPSYRAQPQQRQQQMQQPRQSQQRQYYGAPQQHQQGAPASNVATQAPAQPAPVPQQPPAQPVNAWGAANDAWKAQQNGGATAQPTPPPAPAPAPTQQAQPQQQPAPPVGSPTGSALGALGGMASAMKPPSSSYLDGDSMQPLGSSFNQSSLGSAVGAQHEASDAWGGSGGGGDAMKEAPLDAPEPMDGIGTGGPQRRHGMGGGVGRRSFYGE